MTGPRNNIQKGKQQKMFLVTDRTGTTPHTTKLNDIKDLKYVVTQITFDESIGNAAEIIAANMRFGDKFNYSGKFEICCIADNELTKAVTKNIVFAAHEKLKYCTDDYAERIWQCIKTDVINDVLACADGGINGFTSGDIALAIGRAIATRFEIKV